MPSSGSGDWLTDFVAWGSHGEADPRMLWWVGASTVAAALRRKCWIDQVYFQWTPNLYIVLIAPPGVAGKSTTVDIGARLLRAADLPLGATIATWQALFRQLAKSQVSWTMPDGTRFPMACLHATVPELGTFLQPEEADQIDVLVDLWDGRLGVTEKITKTQGEDRIENPWVNLIGCTTPRWIEENLPHYMSGGGFLSRCVFVRASKKHRLVAYPASVVPPGHAAEQARLAQRLREIAVLAGPAQMTPGAYEWGTKWYGDYWRGVNGWSLDSGHAARRQTFLHKLAMILSASCGQYPCIDVGHFMAAEAALASVEEDTAWVHARLGLTTVTGAAKRLAELVAAHNGEIRVRDAYRRVAHFLSATEFEEALRGLRVAGEVAQEERKGVKWLISVKEP